MESGQVRELTSLLEHEPPPGVLVPDFALRAPAPYSVLVTEERWSKLAVLDFNRGCGPGWKAFQLRWDIFNVPRPHDRVAIAIPGDRFSTSLARTWQDMADLIRRLEGTSFYLESPGSVELFVRFAQRMADDLDSTAAARQHIRPAFQSAALDSRRGRNGRTAAYKPPYLLQCLLLCQSIRSFLLQRKRDRKTKNIKQQQVEQRNFENQTRSSDGMKTVIEDVLALAVPPFMGATISEMRTLVREMTPHKATMSRFRMMVDAAFIYYQRPP